MGKDKDDREKVVSRILAQQSLLADLTQRVEHVQTENAQLREENSLLKDYIDNLMAKAGSMPKIGTLPPSQMRVRQNPDSALSVKVNKHIGELTAPVVD